MNILWTILIAYFLLRVVARIFWYYIKKEGTTKILLIDDMRDIKADVVARTFDEGIKALKNKGPFTTLYLDHDLGDENPTKTGYDIMCFLEENPQYLPERILCISANPVGRQKIQVVIEKLYNGVNK